MRPEIYQREDGLRRLWENSILPLLAEYHYGSSQSRLDHYELDELRKASNGEADTAEES